MNARRRCGRFRHIWPTTSLSMSSYQEAGIVAIAVVSFTASEPTAM